MVLVRGFYSLENRLFKFSLNKNAVIIGPFIREKIRRVLAKTRLR